jgi:hypothetical protein
LSRVDWFYTWAIFGPGVVYGLLAARIIEYALGKVA